MTGQKKPISSDGTATSQISAAVRSTTILPGESAEEYQEGLRAIIE
jgi:hypothetical protein